MSIRVLAAVHRIIGGVEKPAVRIAVESLNFVSHFGLWMTVMARLGPEVMARIGPEGDGETWA